MKKRLKLEEMLFIAMNPESCVHLLTMLVHVFHYILLISF